MDPKINIDGNLYYAKTKVPCATCARWDRFMYIKQRIENTTVLECPVCENVTHMPNEMVEKDE